MVFSTFDRSTRLLPFVLYDSYIFPGGARGIAGALSQAGFPRTRAVFQLWNPNFRPSHARLDGRPLQMLLLSSMQMHVKNAYEAIRDAWSMGPDRPLIVCGGSKAIYEPYHYWPLETRAGRRVGPDVVVSGESYVFLDLLNAIAADKRPRDTMRQAFERARRDGALNAVPGLVYLAPHATFEEPVLVDTGLQRLVQCLDELPHEMTSLSLLEPPHRGFGLSPRPIPENRVGRHARIISLAVTQGCKFNCSYCPLPAYNQKTWRYRSPEGLVQELRLVFEKFHIKHFYGADDNFFNKRQTSKEILKAMAGAKIQGHPLGQKVRFYTEATQFDTWKNRDLLPVAQAAGLKALWFGIEDLTAELINKGQKPEVTLELFKLLHQHKIMPMAMMMFHEGQPFYTPHSLYGLYNQVDFLRRAGAISLQCTVHIPAPGTREYDKTYFSGRVLRRVGGYVIPEAKIDGNHVLVKGKEEPWRKQLKLWGGYLAFYNPLNLVRALLARDGSRLWKYRVVYQALGFVATLWTGWKMLPYMLRLKTSSLQCYQEPPPLHSVPVQDAPQAFPRYPTLQPTREMVESERLAA
ncbi:MAG: radical SAM protein [Planctomycetes bacterium]|nr:radical SAM protein [Planctomycetota bacterium]